MPRYVIEREFLVPVFEHLFVEAPDLETACRRAMDDLVEPWGDFSEISYDDARPTTIAQAVEIPEGMCPELRSREDEDRHALSELLYSSGLDLLPIPTEFAEDNDQNEEPVGFA